MGRKINFLGTRKAESTVYLLRIIHNLIFTSFIKIKNFKNNFLPRKKAFFSKAESSNFSLMMSNLLRIQWIFTDEKVIEYKIFKSTLKYDSKQGKVNPGDLTKLNVIFYRQNERLFEENSEWSQRFLYDKWSAFTQV